MTRPKRKRTPNGGFETTDFKTAALSITVPYPASCGAAVSAVPGARYCKRSFGFARLSRFRSPRSVRMPRLSIGAQARYPCALPPFRLPSATFPCAGWATLVVLGVVIGNSFSRKRASADLQKKIKLLVKVAFVMVI